MNIKERLKWLLKLGQTTPSNTTTGPTTVSGSPSPMETSVYFPSVSKAWGPENVNNIQYIINLLNQSLYVLSSGQMDLNQLRVSQFNVDTSKYPDAVIMAVVRFSQLFYHRVLTNSGNQAFDNVLTTEERKQRINQLIQYVNSSALPGGPINSFLKSKINGDLKELLLAGLALIK